MKKVTLKMKNIKNNKENLDPLHPITARRHFLMAPYLCHFGEVSRVPVLEKSDH